MFQGDHMHLRDLLAFQGTKKNMNKMMVQTNFYFAKVKVSPAILSTFGKKKQLLGCLQIQ